MFTMVLVENLAQELLGPFLARIRKELLWRRVFDDLAGIHKDDAVRRGFGESHLV